MRLCAKCQKLSIVLSLPFNVTLLTSVFKYFLPSFFCTDISLNFIQESPILQFSVAKSRISLSSIQPILGPLMPQKSVFRQKADQCTHCRGALLKKQKRVSSYCLNGSKNHLIFIFTNSSSRS